MYTQQLVTRKRFDRRAAQETDIFMRSIGVYHDRRKQDRRQASQQQMQHRQAA